MGLLLWLWIATAAFAAPAFAADELFDQIVPLPAGGAVALSNVNGPITVTGWDRDVVEVRAVKTAPLAADLTRVRIVVEPAPGRVSIATIYPHGESAEVAVAYRVYVPHRAQLAQVATVNGTVSVSGMEGIGELRSVNGNIDVSDSAAGFSARTTNGSIHMQLTHLATSAKVDAETVNGSIALELPGDAAATLDVSSLTGDFHSELPVAIAGAYSARGVHGRIGGGGAPVRLYTVNGAIRVLTLAKAL
jgi:DUF4097 and DUF4098 domain-containing protein YvlB